MPTSAKARKAAQTADDTKDEVQDTLKDNAASSRDMLQEKAASARQTAANAVDDATQKVRDASEAIDPNELINQAAAHLSDAAQAIRSTDLHKVQTEVTGFARRNPLLVAGGMAVLGFAAGRMMKTRDTTTETRLAQLRDALDNYSK